MRSRSALVSISVTEQTEMMRTCAVLNNGVRQSSSESFGIPWWTN